MCRSHAGTALHVARFNRFHISLSDVQVAGACEDDPACFLYDVRGRGSSLVRLGAADNITAAAAHASFVTRLAFLDAAERHMELVCLVATFCLIPPGDTATRKGLFDAILFGCVPVLFYRESADFPWFLPRDVGTFAVLLSAAEVLHDSASVMRRLRAVPADAVAAKRTVLAGLARRVQYSAADGRSKQTAGSGPDAYEVMLGGVRRAALGMV
jgi:Exostosin family